MSAQEKWMTALSQNKTINSQIYLPSDEIAFQEFLRDFGGIAVADPAVVLKPTDSSAIQKILELANHFQLQLTPRCYGLSQSGQALAPYGAAVLNLSTLQKLNEVNEKEKYIVAEVGVSWAQIVEKTASQGLLPFVLPFNLDLSVGGVLSAGGIGASSHHHGACAYHIKNLEIVTGTAENQICSQQQFPELFQAVLATAGRFGIIHKAAIQLRSFKPKTRTFYLVYDDHEKWLDDQVKLSQLSAINHMEAFCSASLQGSHHLSRAPKPLAVWLYGLQISTEFAEDESPQLDAISEPLNYWRHLHTEDNDTVSFIKRHNPRFRMMQQTGLWQQCHPWLECFIEYNAIKTLLPRLLTELPLSLGGICHLFPVKSENFPTWMMAPREADVFAFTILPGGVAKAQCDGILKQLQEIHRLLIEKGGKRYLSGYLFDPDISYWKQHYGEKYSAWQTMKMRYDPNSVLNSQLFKVC